jgi:hypothetical protein
MRTLDFGCGIRREPDSIGVDVNPKSQVRGTHSQHLLGAHWLANRYASFFERFLAYLLPTQDIRFELEAIKA